MRSPPKTNAYGSFTQTTTWAAAGRNVTLRQALGQDIVMLDTSVELEGDIFTPLRALLDDRGGVAGRWGAVTSDLRSFEEAGSSGEVDAVEGYLMAFRRDLLREVGLLDEKYRFYRHLDLDFSFAARSRGIRAVIDTALPVTRHEHVEWSATPPEERDRLSKRNFYGSCASGGSGRTSWSPPRASPDPRGTFPLATRELCAAACASRRAPRRRVSRNPCEWVPNARALRRWERSSAERGLPRRDRRQSW